MEITFFKCLTTFHWTLSKNVHEIVHSKIEGKHFIAHVKHVSGSILKFGTSWQWQLQYENTMEITFFNCLTTFHWTLLKNVHEFRLPIPKLSENTILNMPNTFLEAFLKFQTTWQWELQYGKYYGNHCFSIVWQPSMEHCLKMFMNLDCPYQNWRKTLYWTCQTHFWKHF